MITKYITQITATFNPLSASRSHKIPRLILSRIPSSPAAGSSPIKVAATVLPQSSSQAGSVAVAFRDGKEVLFVGEETTPVRSGGAIDMRDLSIRDVIEELDRHSRVLRRKEEIGGN